MYDDSARVPLIVAGPGFKKGITDSTASNQLDLNASLFHAVGCDMPSNMHGQAMQTLKTNDHSRSTFCEYHGHGTRASSFMIRKGPWKFLYNCEAPNQLFNIDEDPQELNNRISQNQSIARDLETELRNICDPDKENVRTDEYLASQLAEAERQGVKTGEGGIAGPKT